MFLGTPFQILDFACAQQFVHTWGKVIWKGSAVVAKSTIIIEYYNCVSKHLPHILSSLSHSLSLYLYILQILLLCPTNIKKEM